MPNSEDGGSDEEESAWAGWTRGSSWSAPSSEAVAMDGGRPPSSRAAVVAADGAAWTGDEEAGIASIPAVAVALVDASGEEDEGAGGGCMCGLVDGRMCWG